MKIRTGLKRPADKYPLSEALIDVEEYYKAGSIPAAVQGIIEQSGAIAKEATEKLKRIQPASETEVEQITDFQTRFIALYNAWKSAPESETGKKALAIANNDLVCLWWTVRKLDRCPLILCEDSLAVKRIPIRVKKVGSHWQPYSIL